MIPFHSVCPNVAASEVRSITVPQRDDLPAGEYAFIELYCDDLSCDCRRVLIEVWSRPLNGKAVAHINFGWERQSFYEKWSVAPRDIARQMARATTTGSLDPINPQAPYAPKLLDAFREMIRMDPQYPLRLKHHYNLFRKTLLAARNQ